MTRPPPSGSLRSTGARSSACSAEPARASPWRPWSGSARCSTRPGSATRSWCTTARPTPSSTGPSTSTGKRARPPGGGCRVMMVLDRQINPSIAAHGGHAELVGVEEGTAYLRLSGGCQGCRMATVTLGQGIEVRSRSSSPRSPGSLTSPTKRAARTPTSRPRRRNTQARPTVLNDSGRRIVAGIGVVGERVGACGAESPEGGCPCWSSLKVTGSSWNLSGQPGSRDRRSRLPERLPHSGPPADTSSPQPFPPFVLASTCSFAGARSPSPRRARGRRFLRFVVLRTRALRGSSPTAFIGHRGPRHSLKRAASSEPPVALPAL
jgi:Fe-S cluster biogenesis protein NfuA